MECVKRRQTLALIIKDSQHIGSLEINEYRVAPFTGSDDFLDEMDAHSQATYDLASVICANWEDVDDVSQFGDIVDLNRAWVSASFSDGKRFSAATNALIEHLYGSRSLLMLKAFPLEYESKVTEENVAAFHRRQEAMKRHYQRLFAVSPFPGVDGELV